MRCLGDHPYVPFRNTVLPVPTDYTIFEILLSRCTGLLELLRGICAIVCPNGMNGRMKMCCEIFKTFLGSQHFRDILGNMKDGEDVAGEMVHPKVTVPIMLLGR